MSDVPPYPSAPDPQQPPATPPPPTFGGYGTPPPPPPPVAPPPGYGTGGPYAGPPAYDVIEAVKYGWRKFADNLGVFLVLGVILLVVSGGSSGIDITFGSDGILVNKGSIGDGAAVLVSIVVNVLSTIISVVISFALLRGALDVTAGVPVTLGSVFTRWRFWPVVGAGLLMLLISIPGFILCILPGVVVIFLLWYAPYFAMDGQSPVEALKSSFALVKARVGDNLLLLLMVVLGGILAVCTCGLGAVVIQPLTTIATAYSYRFFKGEPIAP